MKAFAHRRLEDAQGMRGHLFDLPPHMLDDLAVEALACGWRPWVRWPTRYVLWTDDLPRCRPGGCATPHCGPRCRCDCHDGHHYAPGEGWLSVAEARSERGGYLDMDAAIERSYDDLEGP